MKKNLLLFTLLALFLGAWTTQMQAKSVTVSNLEELQDAINTRADIIYVSKTIILSGTVELDARGKIISVPTPYIGEDGMAVDGTESMYGVFNISEGQVTLKNMTIYGGYSSYLAGGITINRSVVSMENVTVSRCYSGVQINNGSSVVMKHCNIVRNVREYGGGVLLGDYSKLMMDGCSLSENRSLSGSGGGGAMEIQYGCYLYANNTVIANNSSTELGGAINLCSGTALLQNCTVSGNYNITEYPGGGIANNSGVLYAVNTIFMDNYHWTGDPAEEPIRSDIGIYWGNDNYLYNCIYGGIEGSSSDYTTTNCINETEKIFAAYRTDGVFYRTNDNTPDYKHSVLTPASVNGKNLYAPGGENMKNGGVATYLSYDDSLKVVKMGYGDSNDIQPLTPELDAPAAEDLVTTYFEGGTRDANIIGASDFDPRAFYTIKLLPGYSHIYVKNISVFGDSYPEGTVVPATALTVEPNYVFDGWKETPTSTELLSTTNPFDVALTKDQTLFPTVTLWDFRLNETKDTLFASHEVDGVTTEKYATIEGMDFEYDGSFADPTIILESGYPIVKEDFDIYFVNEKGDTTDYALAPGNYTVCVAYYTYVMSTDIQISKANLTIVADTLVKTYGSIDPELTYSVSGLAKKDTLFTFLIDRVAGETPGEYPITVIPDTLMADSLLEVLDCYNIILHPGLLIIQDMTLEPVDGNEDNEFFMVSAAGYCQDDEAGILFSIENGEPTDYSVTFSEAAKQQGFEDIAKTAMPSGDTKSISFKVPANCKYGKYTADVYFYNVLNLEPIKLPVTFTVNIPAADIKQLFDDVVAVDNKEGLYTGYQWYCNGVAIPGATEQYYCQEGGLNGIYYVEVSVEGLNYDAVSCVEEFVSEKKQNMPVRKIFRSNELIIITPQQEYNANGMLVK